MAKNRLLRKILYRYTEFDRDKKWDFWFAGAGNLPFHHKLFIARLT
jgi:hypothetical protein